MPDDLVGWKEPGRDGKSRWQPGILPKGEMTRDDAELFVLKARVAAGWVEAAVLEEELAKRAAELEAAEAEFEGELDNLEAAEAAFMEVEGSDDAEPEADSNA